MLGAYVLAEDRVLEYDWSARYIPIASSFAIALILAFAEILWVVEALEAIFIAIAEPSSDFAIISIAELIIISRESVSIATTFQRYGIVMYL